MLKPLRYIFFLTWLALLEFTPAQTDSSSLTTEEILEDILQEPGEEIDNSNLFDMIERLQLNPINLNDADISKLQQIPGLDVKSAIQILEYRDKYGYFFSVDELNAIKDFNKELIAKIKPFITVKRVVENGLQKEDSDDIIRSISKSTILFLRSRYSDDLQTRKGFIENKFTGTKFKSYNRLLVKYNDHFQLGILTEKDPGEKAINDFSSYHLAFKNLEIINELVLGDYLFEFGQGLVMWSPYGLSKGADAVYPLKKKNNNLKPYTSSTENNYLRGIASTFSLSEFSLTAFYSKNKFDASIDSVTGKITSLPVDGFHRTQTEINKRNAAEEKLIGARIDYRNYDFLQTGILYFKSDISNEFFGSGVYDLRGRIINYTSFYYDLYLNNINVFGELAYDGTSTASLNSFQMYLGQNFSFITLVRSYPRNFHSLHGFAFGEKSGVTSNEFGIYSGIKWKLPIGILNLYYDQFKFPFATYSNPLPTTGEELLADLSSKPFLRVETRIRYKYKNKEVRIVQNNSDKLAKRLKQLARFEVIYYPFRQLRLKGRFEFNSYRIVENDTSEKGYLLFQDVRFTPNSLLNIFARISIFKTDSFNSAIYEYENDLFGVLTNRALFGEGIRWYLIVRYKPIAQFAISFKYSETYKPNEKSLSSGLNEIPGNLDNRISFQIDIHF